MNQFGQRLFFLTTHTTTLHHTKHNKQEGKRVPTQPCSWLLRNLVRLIALALLAMGLAVNFAGFFHDDSSNAGMSGCVGRWLEVLGLMCLSFLCSCF